MHDARKELFMRVYLLWYCGLYRTSTRAGKLAQAPSGIYTRFMAVRIYEFS
jgi:hypothetical protein